MHRPTENEAKNTAHKRKQQRQQPVRPPEPPLFPEREAPVWKPMG